MPTPTKWPLKSLGDVAANVPYAIVDGPFGSNMKSSDYVASGIPVLQGKNITNDSFRWFDIRYVSNEKAIELKRSSVRVDDILLVKIGSIGYAAVIDSLSGHDYAIIPANLAKITPNKDLIDTRYLFRWLTSPDSKRYFQSNASKTAQPALSLAKIKSLPVLVPSVPEQRRVAAILDKVDTLRAKRRQGLAQLDSLVESLFIEMFGDAVTNPKNWPVKPLGECAEKIQIGPFGTQLHEEDYVEGGIPLINPTHLRGGIISPDSSLTVSSEKYAQLSNYYLRKDDLIMGRRGEMGRCAVITQREQGWLCGTGSLFVRPKTDVINPTYLSLLISSPSMTRFLENIAQGVTMANLNKSIVAGLPIAVPPLANQSAFVTRLNAIQAIREYGLASLAELDVLFASLQHRAFRGEL
jgi:type I restriction enzyme S subunit